MGGELNNQANNTGRGRKMMEASIPTSTKRNSKSFGMRKTAADCLDKTSTFVKRKGIPNLKKKEKITIVAKMKTFPNEELSKIELIQEKNPDKMDYDLIYNSIGKHFFMQTLNDQSRNEIILNMSLYRVKANEVLYSQGQNGNYWYIVHSGTLEFYIDEKLNKTYEAGDSFGEYALMNNAPRNGTVKTITECELWALKREVFHKILNYLFALNFEENMKFLKTIDLPLDDNMRTLMANNLLQNIYKQDEVIFREGEPGSCLYIIKSGEVNCVKNGKIVRTLVKGDNFGTKALLEGDRRTLDCVCKTDCILYSVSVDFFKSQFGEDFKKQLYFSLMSIAFKKSKNFNVINPKMLNNTFKYFTIKQFKKNEVVYEKGTNLQEKFCVILEGDVVDQDMNKTEGKRYEILYEDEYKKNSTFIAKHDLIAVPDCTIAEADFKDIRNALGGSIKLAKVNSSKIGALEKVAIFRYISDEKKDTLIKELKVETFNNGKKIIIQGSTNNKLYIIKEGRVDMFVNSKYARSLGEGDDFGSKCLVFNNTKNQTTVIANGTVSCYTLNADCFKNILDPNLMEYFQKKYYLEDYSIELDDLDNIKELGKGNYGSVNLVRSKKNKQLYAIKALNLPQIKQEKLESAVELEKNVLLKCDHPFIMKMVKYLKNDDYIFFINEYIKGKELWEIMREIDLLNKDQVQFYGASLLVAVNYLHKNSIIYRDIKPENIMVTDKGYIKIVDFGTVKEIKDRTSTIVGTSQYMAPEMVKGTGYSFEVDIWSIAICMYELACGKVPFGEELEEPLEVYEAISKEDLVFPSFIHDVDFMNLLIKMLKKSPNNRLWKFEQIKEEEYFKNFKWDELASLALPAPYIPKLPNDFDNEVSGRAYLSVLKNKDMKKNYKKMKSLAQVKFEKWVKNF